MGASASPRNVAHALPSRPACRLAGRLDFIQAISGVVLISFLWAHVLLVSSVIISPKLMTGIAVFFEVTYMAPIFGPIIFAIMLFHFVIAARKMPFRTGEFCTFAEHAKMLRHADTWLWLVQVGTALAILIMGSIHMYVVLADMPITAVKSAARVQSGWLGFYLLLLPLAELHVGIGLYRLGVKYGYITRASRALWKRREFVLTAIFVGIGLLTLLRFYLLPVVALPVV